MSVQSARLIDGKALSQRIQEDLKQRIAHLTQSVGRRPGLAVLMVGDDGASEIYVRNKRLACQRVGIASTVHHLSEDTDDATLKKLIQTLNADDSVDGILLQLPLPPSFNPSTALNAIDPSKDVDGLHPTNLGRLVRGEPGLRSCTPLGVMRLLAAEKIDPAGKKAVVVGHSILVGKPMALMLLEADATVEIAHIKTVDLATATRQADILVTATGKVGLIAADMVKPGAAVIDVGITRIPTQAGKTRLVGDVQFDAVQAIAGWITPVPGGVGPMTVTMLLQNTLESYLKRCELPQ